MLGQTLGRYRLEEEVGQGGMAVVYRAWDGGLDREVAVKILHKHLASQEAAKSRFSREAKAVARLRHRNILEIYDFSGADSAESYIVTELIRGRNLRDFVGEEPMPLAEIAALITIQICDALGHAHALGILHRDMKPENIMVRDDGVLKLMDFGIAQMVDAQSLTMTGTLLGSPAHMAPEHIEGKPLDFRADVFAVGTILYYLATGRLPFVADNPHAVFRKIMEGDYRPPGAWNPMVGDLLTRITRRAMARHPDDRYPTMDALAADLREFVRRSGIEDVDKELAEYFRRPREHVAALKPRIIEHLMAEGRVCMRAGRVGEAVDAFNRILSMDEENMEVRAELERLNRARRMKGVYRWAAAAMLPMALVVSGVWYMSTRPVAPATTAVTSAAGLRPRTGASVTTAAPAGAGTAALGPRPVETATPEPTPPATGAVKLVSATARPKKDTAKPFAPAERVTIEVILLPDEVHERKVSFKATSDEDGAEIRELGKILGGTGTVLLQRGRTYTLSFSADSFEPYSYVYTVAAEGPPKRIEARFDWAPAKLKVDADCMQFEFRSVGRPTVRKSCGKPVKIELGGAALPGTVTFATTTKKADGGKVISLTETHDVNLVAGGDVTIRSKTHAGMGPAPATHPEIGGAAGSRGRKYELDSAPSSVRAPPGRLTGDR